MRVIIDRSDEPFTRQVRVWFMRGSVDGFTTYTTIGEHGEWVHTNIPTGTSQPVVVVTRTRHRNERTASNE